MPHPTDKVQLTLPTGTVVRWPAPTYREGRQLLQLVEDVVHNVPNAFQALLDLVESLSHHAPELDELIPLDVLELAVSFSMAPRVRATGTEPTGTPSPP